MCAIILSGSALPVLVGPPPAAGNGAPDLGGTEQLLFSTLIGTDTWEAARSMARDDEGNLYVTGDALTASFAWPTPPSTPG